MIFSTIVKRFGGFNKLRISYLNSSSSFKKSFFLFIHRGYQHETNSYLPFETKIASPINFVHGVYGIFISGGAVIGENCAIFQQVTIGSNMLIDSKGFGSPTIGKNCLIGAGAKIIGNVKIGDNCRIGANAVVTSDMPDNSVCILGKSIVLQKEHLENQLYTKSKLGWGYIENGVFLPEKDNQKLDKLNQL